MSGLVAFHCPAVGFKSNGLDKTSSGTLGDQLPAWQGPLQRVDQRCLRWALQPFVDAFGRGPDFLPLWFWPLVVCPFIDSSSLASLDPCLDMPLWDQDCHTTRAGQLNGVVIC